MPAGLEFAVHVRPGVRHTEVGGSHDGVLVVRVRAPAVDGRANDEVGKAVAAAFGVRPSAVSIVRGATARRKQLHVEGDPATLASRLAALTGN